MKVILSLAFLTSCLVLAGCGDPEATIVAPPDEATQYNVPEGEMEAAMQAAMESSAKPQVVPKAKPGG